MPISGTCVGVCSLCSRTVCVPGAGCDRRQAGSTHQLEHGSWRTVWSWLRLGFSRYLLFNYAVTVGNSTAWPIEIYLILFAPLLYSMIVLSFRCFFICCVHLNPSSIVKLLCDLCIVDRQMMDCITCLLIFDFLDVTPDRDYRCLRSKSKGLISPIDEMPLFSLQFKN